MKPEPIGTFRNTLKSAREKAGLSVGDLLADLQFFNVNMTEEEYMLLENGQVYPNSQIGLALSGVIGKTISMTWPADLSKGD